MVADQDGIGILLNFQERLITPAISRTSMLPPNGTPDKRGLYSCSLNSPYAFLGFFKGTNSSSIKAICNRV